MTIVQVSNHTRPLKTVLSLHYYDHFFDRLRGLMFHPPLHENEGIILVQKYESRSNASIHMLFMRMDLTVVWVNEDLIVVDIRLAKRWRLAYLPAAPAKYVLEMSTARFSEFKIGDHLSFDIPVNTGMS
jgi:uncharacterized membrane protein (UPF0127 family)